MSLAHALPLTWLSRLGAARLNGLMVALGVVMLIIGAPLYFLLVVIYARVFLEIIMVIFQMAEHMAEIAAQGGRGPA